MGRKARVYSAEYVKNFEDKFYATFPEVKQGAAYRFRDVTQVMKLVGLNPTKSSDFPQWMFSNKSTKGLYKMPTKSALVAGTPEADAALAPKVKVKANKSKKAGVGPSINSQRWASGKAPVKGGQAKAALNPAATKIEKTTKSDRDITGAYDDSVEYEDVLSLRNEFGLGDFKNTFE
jgi:hypothetical protein